MAQEPVVSPARPTVGAHQNGGAQVAPTQVRQQAVVAEPAPGPQATRATTRRAPAIVLPDGRDMATATAAAFLAHQALSAWHQARGRLAPVARVPWVLSTPMVTPWDVTASRTAPGSRGWVVAALSGRMRGDEGDKVTTALADLVGSRGSGDAAALADEVCWVLEGARDVTVTLRPRHNPSAAHPGDDRLPGGDRQAGRPNMGAGTLGPAWLGWSQPWPLKDGRRFDLEDVAVPTRGAAPPEPDGNRGDGSQCDGQEPSYASAWTPEYARHPVPLLVPLGTVATEGVWHVNLASLGNLLIAGGTMGGPRGLALTLLAHIAAQAHPSQVEMLVVAGPGAFDAVEELPHLCAPVADPRKTTALAAVLDIAEERVLARTAWLRAGDDGGDDMAESLLSPDEDGEEIIPPRLLVVLDRIEEWALDWALALRLRTLGVAGPPVGVTLLATTAEVSALGAGTPTPAGASPARRVPARPAPMSLGALLLFVFRGRVSYRLDSVQESDTVLGGSGAEDLEGSDLLVAVGWDAQEGQARGDEAQGAPYGPFAPLALPARLRALALSESAAGEMIAAVAATMRRVAPRPVDPGRAGEVATGDERAPGVHDAPDRASGVPAALVEESGAPSPTIKAPAAPAPSTLGGEEDGDTMREEPHSGAEGETSAAALEPPLPPASAEHQTAVPQASAPLTIAVTLLGQQRATINGRSLLEAGEDGLPAPLSGMALLLLSYLVLQRGTPVSGETIAAHLWPESQASSKSFHKALSRLREGLGGLLGVPGRDLVRRTGMLYTLDQTHIRADVLQVEELLAEAESADDTTRAALWWRAVDLYQGDLYGAEAPAWAMTTRHRLHDAVIRTLRRLSRWEEGQGNLRGAIAAAERLAQLEPDNEAAHRLVMRLQARSGDLAAALRHYQRWVATLHAEVGSDVEPEEKTQELYRTISRHEAREEYATLSGLDDERE